MKEINIKVTIIVPNNFKKEDSEWDIEDAVIRRKYEWYTEYIND